ncbi:hypothetical protein NHX12_006722, partial [Muraenolepis orangiensis]
MLFCPPQPDSYRQHSAAYIREALAPFLKHEARHAEEHASKRNPFQYVLCAATSPAAKQQEETLTYLNQVVLDQFPHKRSAVRVLFHDRRLQYAEHQQMEGWRWSRPGDRILDIDIALSVGVMEPRAPPQLNTIEFLWSPEKNASVFIQVDTFSADQQGDYLEPVHSSSCQVKVFKCSPTSCTFTDGNCSPNQQGELLLPSCSDHLLPSASPPDTQQWLNQHRFSPFQRLFSSFSGSDLLRMNKDDLVQICGPADGIRLFNTIRGRCIQPRLTIYVCQQQSANPPPRKPVYHALYLEDLTLVDLSEKIASLYNLTPQQITAIY